MNKTRLTPRLTPSTRAVLRYYLSLNQERFCLSLEAIASTALGTSLGKKPKVKTVQRANDRLRELGILSWKSGHGAGDNGFPAHPNEYRLESAALRAYRRAYRRMNCAPVSVSVPVDSTSTSTSTSTSS